jgi:PAS domain S-box-containing protein
MSLKPQLMLDNDRTSETPSEHRQSVAAVHPTEDEPEGGSIPQGSLPSIYFTLDSTGMVLAVNPVGAASLGYAVEELIEQPVFSLVHPENRAKLQAEFTDLAQHPAQVVKGKFCLLHKDGSSVSVTMTAQALQGTGVNTVYLLISEGFSEHQAVEIVAQESQPCYGMKIDELAQQVKDWRSRVATLLQQIDSTVATQAASELPHERQLLKDISEELSSSLEEILVVQEQLSQQSEDLVQLHEELVVTHQTVEAERQRYRELFEFAPDGYLVTDAEGIIQEANCAAANLLTFSQTFLVGKLLISFVAQSERLTFDSQLKIASKGNKVHECVVRLQPRKRWYSDISLKVAPARDRTGKLVALHWLLRDITEPKGIEEELSKYRNHLEQLVREHTAELQRANEQLQQEIAERKQAEEALQQQILRERLVAAISQHIRQSLNLEEILNTTVAQVQQFLTADRVLLYRVWSNGTGSTVTEAVVPGLPAVLGQTFSEEVFPQASQRLYSQGRVLAINDIEQAEVSPCLAEFVKQFGVKAKLVVPILQGKQLWGLLIAHQCSEPRQWQQFEIDLLKQLATQLAIAIQQSELYKQTQHQIQREQALNRVIQTIRNSLDLKTIFSTATFEVANLLQADRASIVQYLPERKVWLNVAHYCQNLDLPSALGLEIPDEGNEIATRLKRLEVVRIDELSTCKDEINRKIAQTFPGAWLLVPLHFGSLVWGSFSLVKNNPSSSWQNVEVELTCAVADQLAIAIQQSQLFQQVQRLNVNLERQVQARTAQLELAFEFEATLKRITDRVRDSLDEGQILQTAVQELAIGLGVNCCNAALYDFDKGTSTICYEYTTLDSPTLRNVVQMTAFPEIYSQLLQGQCFQFCSVSADSVQGQVAKLVCPIFDDQGVLGDLWLLNNKYYGFAEQDIRLVQQVANQCAIAMRQARLYQAAHAQVEELEKLNRLKDDFLSTVSHELRTPVCNIRMAAQLLEMELAQTGLFDGNLKAAARYFHILQDECQREISLINNLLDLSRIEAGTEPLMLTTIDPKIWIPSIAEPFIERAENQQQHLQINIPSQLPTLTTDLTNLERILTEVLNNACKYTPPGGTITVSAQAVNDTLQVYVSNTGVEIPQEELTHIFDKFYRIPNNDPWKHGGTGLGLALVKKLVEQLKGTIQVNSSKSQTTFTLQFPLTEKF